MNLFTKIKEGQRKIEDKVYEAKIINLEQKLARAREVSTKVSKIKALERKIGRYPAKASPMKSVAVGFFRNAYENVNGTKQKAKKPKTFLGY